MKDRALPLDPAGAWGPRPPTVWHREPNGFQLLVLGGVQGQSPWPFYRLPQARPSSLHVLPAAISAFDRLRLKSTPTHLSPCDTSRSR